MGNPTGVSGHVSKMINHDCPWCSEKFDKMGIPLRGMEMESRHGRMIIWFHVSCFDLFDKSKKNLRFNGTRFEIKKD